VVGRFKLTEAETSERKLTPPAVRTAAGGVQAARTERLGSLPVTR
jgi:hypothetical protein